MPDKCTCKHDIKEINNRYRHVRTARGSELLTMSCLEGDCPCLEPELEVFGEWKGSVKHMTNLPELRKKWESGLEVVAAYALSFNLVVVLRQKDGCLRVHQYFQIGDDWTVSVEARCRR